MAQIHAKRLKDGATRKDVKVALIRLLYERGFSREQVVQLFIIIDWMLQLPSALEPEFVQAVHDIQEEKHMPYVNTIERLAIERGRQETLEEAEERVLENKRSAARRLIARSEMDDQLIAEIEELPVEEVARLRAETQH